jgi:hypothetical protein
LLRQLRSAPLRSLRNHPRPPAQSSTRHSEAGIGT